MRVRGIGASLIALAAVVGAMSVNAADLDMNLRLDRKGAAVQPTMYGLFFEDIGHREKRTTLGNNGFWGMAFNSGATYRFSVWARCVAGHESVVSEGDDKWTTLSGMINKYGASLVGRKAIENYGNEFPLLVKFIDARQDLSVLWWSTHPGAAAKADTICYGRIFPERKDDLAWENDRAAYRA